MISELVPVFPNNAVSLIATRVTLLEAEGLFVHRRPLRETDEVQCVGVFAGEWLPNEESYEMKGGKPALHEPTIGRYTIGVQAFVKDMDEERGLARHSVLAKMLRSMLYRDAPLHIGLRALSVQMFGSTERTQKFGIKRQRYISNELDGTWLYLSTLEFWLDTETE